MDQRFHRALHLARAAAARSCGRSSSAGPSGISATHCRMICSALAHLLDAHEIAVVAVAVLADRNVELHLVVDVVGLRLAQIPGHAGGAQHRPGEAPVERILRRHHADIDEALLEDAVLGQQLSMSSSTSGNVSAQAAMSSSEPGRQILMHAAGPEIGRVQPRAADALVELHQQLALLEPPQERRHRADIQGVGGDVQQMVEDARDLVEQHADVLAARRHLEAEQLLDRQREGVLLAHRRDVVEPVEIGDRLQIGLVFDQLLGAAMEQADMRIERSTTSPSISRTRRSTPWAAGCCGPKFMVMRLDLDFGHQGFFSAFSSPGSRRTMPSHGLTKSKLRNSWRQLDRLVDDALLLLVVAHLDIAGEREVLAQRMPLEAVVGEDAAQIGMIGEDRCRRGPRPRARTSRRR